MNVIVTANAVTRSAHRTALIIAVAMMIATIATGTRSAFLRAFSMKI